MIPKHFHWVWIGPKCPDWARRNMALFQELNPEFQSTLHDEEALREEFQPAYKAIQGSHLWARRSDLIRLSILLREGGWYFDCDFLPIRPLAELYEYYDGFPRGCFVTHGAYAGKRPWIANGIIGAVVRSEFLRRARKGVVKFGDLGSLRWGSFGPALFTSLVESFPSSVHVGLIDDFYRLQDRRDSMGAYRRIQAAGYTRPAIVRELGYPLPFAMHMSMQDELSL
jgi:hypothetical protein